MQAAAQLQKTSHFTALFDLPATCPTSCRRYPFSPRFRLISLDFSQSALSASLTLFAVPQPLCEAPQTYYQPSFALSDIIKIFTVIYICAHAQPAEHMLTATSITQCASLQNSAYLNCNFQRVHLPPHCHSSPFPQDTPPQKPRSLFMPPEVYSASCLHLGG